MMNKIHHLIIDWGTTNFRAFAMSEADELIDSKEAGLGLLQVPNGEFAPALEGLLVDWIDEYQNLPIYMAGMVGTMKGWVNVAYAHTPLAIEGLTSNAHVFKLPWGNNPKAVIIPGVCHGYEPSADNTFEKYDVMRGEEVQIFGLAERAQCGTFVAILPGTHSKHAHVENNKLVSFSSYLTGELFDLLTKHSLLGKGLPTDAPSDGAAFIAGVKDGQTGEFSNRIFLAWTQRLFSHLTESQIPDYLSGMLIGMELRNLTAEHIYIVGSEGLSKRYQIAISVLNKRSEIISGNACFLAGMASLIKSIK